MSLFKHVLTGVNQNIEGNNDANWAEWEHAEDCITCYEESYFFGYNPETGTYDRIKENISDEEMQVTVEALQMIIDSNGGKEEEAINYHYNNTYTCCYNQVSGEN
jgi:hypothetical protein